MTGPERATKEQARERTIIERDEAQEFAGDAYYVVTGHSPEWSNNFGYEAALQEIKDCVSVLKQAARHTEATGEAREIANKCLDGVGTTRALTLGALQFVRDRIATALTESARAAEERAIERCAKAICPHCAAGRYFADSGRRFHGYEGFGFAEDRNCRAAAVWDLRAIRVQEDGR